MAELPVKYPLSFTVDYPEEKRNRLTAFFRIFVIIPIAIVLSLLTGGSTEWRDANSRDAAGWSLRIAATGITFLPALLMILFRQKYPKWWYDWNLNLSRFGARVTSYLLLLRDEYPSTDEEQAVHLDFPYPDAKTELSRGLPLVKWFLAIPHYIVLGFLGIAVFAVTVIAWFAILFTGRYPRSLFDFVVGFERWCYRLAAYAFILITDRYPPFSFSE